MFFMTFLCACKYVQDLNKQLLSRKKKPEAAVVSAVANTSSAPVLIALNICNALNWKKWIACINT